VSKGRAPSSSARLAKGLAQPLSQDNKGLKMMQSMGYHVRFNHGGACNNKI
jgi:hypothetical protein